MFWLGGGNREKNMISPNHSNFFDIDEDSLPIGTVVLAKIKPANVPTNVLSINIRNINFIQSFNDLPNSFTKLRVHYYQSTRDESCINN
ncbi:MAG: amidohydrolase [Candidatus Heimdallarchaeota archaeon]|nr:amidohydrolase [Candidatus Heimdallarchaeota archaeon]